MRHANPIFRNMYFNFYFSEWISIWIFKKQIRNIVEKVSPLVPDALMNLCASAGILSSCDQINGLLKRVSFDCCIITQISIKKLKFWESSAIGETLDCLYKNKLTFERITDFTNDCTRTQKQTDSAICYFTSKEECPLIINLISNY